MSRSFFVRVCMFTVRRMRRMQPARGRFARFDQDRQIASTFPAHWKVGPAPVFGASQPLEPAEWLALLILKAGDVERNPNIAVIIVIIIIINIIFTMIIINIATFISKSSSQK